MADQSTTAGKRTRPTFGDDCEIALFREGPRDAIRILWRHPDDGIWYALTVADARTGGLDAIVAALIQQGADDDE